MAPTFNLLKKKRKDAAPSTSTTAESTPPPAPTPPPFAAPRPPPPVGDPPKSFAQLADISDEVVASSWDASMPLKQWLRALQQLAVEGKVYYAEGNYDMAFVRTATVLKLQRDVLPYHHPEWRSLPGEQVAELQRQSATFAATYASLKAFLQSRTAAYYDLYHPPTSSASSSSSAAQPATSSAPALTLRNTVTAAATSYTDSTAPSLPSSGSSRTPSLHGARSPAEGEPQARRHPGGTVPVLPAAPKQNRLRKAFGMGVGHGAGHKRGSSAGSAGSESGAGAVKSKLPEPGAEEREGEEKEWELVGRAAVSPPPLPPPQHHPAYPPHLAPHQQPHAHAHAHTYAAHAPGAGMPLPGEDGSDEEGSSVEEHGGIAYASPTTGFQRTPTWSELNTQHGAYAAPGAGGGAGGGPAYPPHLGGGQQQYAAYPPRQQPQAYAVPGAPGAGAGRQPIAANSAYTAAVPPPSHPLPQGQAYVPLPPPQPSAPPFPAATPAYAQPHQAPYPPQSYPSSFPPQHPQQQQQQQSPFPAPPPPQQQQPYPSHPSYPPPPPHPHSHLQPLPPLPPQPPHPPSAPAHPAASFSSFPPAPSAPPATPTPPPFIPPPAPVPSAPARLARSPSLSLGVVPASLLGRSPASPASPGGRGRGSGLGSIAEMGGALPILGEEGKEGERKGEEIPPVAAGGGEGETAFATTESGAPLRPLLLPASLPQFFMDVVAAENTARGVETCGLLLGRLSHNTLTITHLLVPKQTGTGDTCETTHEEEQFAFQDRHGLLTLGWIHTHPTQSCFLSSRDLHTCTGYQLMLAEAVAVVCAPRFDPGVGVFRLTDPPGLGTIAQCTASGTFHEHPDLPLYTDVDSDEWGHCKMVEGARFECVDLR
ncbi:hypothetical protein JCM6882_001767 [Rhodosporidiobolus microsporus]